jgi:renalase
VIGGGLTSAATSAFINEQFGKQVQLSIWDKARGAGGRMSTSRSPTNPDCIADLGAQYISRRPEHREAHK